ncbi:MAG: hypothetical protein U0325_10705 [Polyangiales bacterium]
MKHTTLGATAALMLVLNACGGTVGDDDADVASGADTLEATAQTQALLSLTTDVTSGAVGAEMAATVAAQNTGAVLQPAGCVQAQAVGAAVNYTFTNCTGPYGLVNVSGTLRATFSNVTPVSRTIVVTGELTANRITLRPNATAQVTFMGGTRLATVTVAGGGSTPRPSTFTNSGTYMSSWDGTCFGLSGRVTSTGSGGASVTVDVSSYRRCRGGCPDVGGRVTVSSARGASVTLQYNGGASATLTGSRGRSVNVALYCGA